MRVLQILTAGASEYERKALKLDRLAAGDLAVQMTSADGALPSEPAGRFDLVHLYGPAAPAAPLLRRLKLPYLASTLPARSILPWGRLPPAARSTSPLAGLPEGVDRSYLAFAPRCVPLVTGRYAIGSCLPLRDGVKEISHTTMGRLSSFRDDIEWLLFDQTPTAQEMAQVDLWVDPTSDPNDWDGGTAEAMSLGILTVAARTPIALLRSRDGKAGILVPPGDGNELTHAIARALFRPETTEELRLEAREAASRFDPSHRAEGLLTMYREVAA